MNKNFPEPEQNYINSMVAAGYYSNEDELLCDAVRFLHEKYNTKTQELIYALSLGEKAIERGEVVPYTPSFLDECEKRALKNISDGKKPKPDVCA